MAGKAVPWTPGLEAYLRDLTQPDAAGTLHLKPSDQASAAVFATLGNWKRDYTKVQHPLSRSMPPPSSRSTARILLS
jgi:hypothetical protein